MFNLFLIGIINMYVILTGGLCIIQFSHFRKFELKLSIVSIHLQKNQCKTATLKKMENWFSRPDIV